MTSDDHTDTDTRWHPAADADAVRETACRQVLDAADEALRERDRFAIVLAGGSTPRGVYRMLRGADTDWSKWHVYFGDERCLPPRDPERNSTMAAEAWLDHVTIPDGQVHVIPAELGPDAAASAYADQLQDVDEFDLVLLGLGEDGHTASLFPGHDPGRAAGSPDAIPVFDAPKPPPQRVSLSAQRLGRSRAVLFLVTGEGKRDALGQWRAGASIPAREIRPASGVDVLVESILLPEKP
ncbi:MAG: 6-phosphogluconolactonase [Pseudomonadota bacterium]|nr:6-phosphogluconolactonase [Pseudomonadota bacterium]